MATMAGATRPGSLEHTILPVPLCERGITQSIAISTDGTQIAYPSGTNIVIRSANSEADAAITYVYGEHGSAKTGCLWC